MLFFSIDCVDEGSAVGTGSVLFMENMNADRPGQLSTSCLVIGPIENATCLSQSIRSTLSVSYACNRQCCVPFRRTIFMIVLPNYPEILSRNAYVA